VAALRILLADDHTIVRHGLRRILEGQSDWAIVGQTSDGRAAVQAAVDLQPDVAIFDIGMPQLNGIEATRQTVKRVPAMRVLVLSMHTEEAYVIQAIEAGARGYLLKDSADTELIHAVTAVAAGKSFFSPDVSRVMLDNYLRQRSQRGVVDRYGSLSAREREVLQLVAEGRSSKEVVDILSISPGTAETHRAHLMEKLGLHNTAEVVLFAVRRGVIS
jgi:DNA-binding NarL/FixJ family response regulator